MELQVGLLTSILEPLSSSKAPSISKYSCIQGASNLGKVKLPFPAYPLVCYDLAA